MFEPNSIRSLLSKRKSNRTQSGKEQQNTKDSSSIQTGLDPDYQSLIEVKLMAKQIQHKIESIRQWREHQKQLMQERLKLNSELVQGMEQVHNKNLQKQAEREEEELRKILEKLKQTTQIKIKQNDQLYDSQQIFKVLTETQHLRQQLKTKNIQASVKPQQNYNLVNEMNEINHIFKKEVGAADLKSTETKQPQKIDSKLIQQEMDEIENQLKEIQQLLADDNQPKASKGSKGKRNS